MKILSIDPGRSTGIAIKDGNIYTTQVLKGESEVWDIVNATRWDAIIIEAFNTAGNISADGLFTVRLIGGVRSLCYIKGIPLTQQMPQQRYAFMARANGILKGVTTQHDKDSLAHLLKWEYDHDEKVADNYSSRLKSISLSTSRGIRQRPRPSTDRPSIL